MNKDALGERLSVVFTYRLHICCYCAVLLEAKINVPFFIFAQSWAAESPGCSRTFWWRVSVISLGMWTSISSLWSSRVMRTVKYTKMFVQNRINTSFVRTVVDKMHKSQMSSQQWFKVKHTRVRTHWTLLVSGAHVSQIVESKKPFTVSVTA